MKYTIADIRKEYDRLDRAVGIDTSGIVLTVSTRAVNRLGCCRFRKINGRPHPFEIRITDFVLDCEDQFWDTIRHEYAHAMVTIIDGKQHYHDNTWKAACRRVGCDPNRTAEKSEELDQKIAESGRKRDYKYAMHCNLCGRTFKYKSAGKFVRWVQEGHGDRLRCPCGGHDFRVECL